MNENSRSILSHLVSKIGTKFNGEYVSIFQLSMDQCSLQDCPLVMSHTNVEFSLGSKYVSVANNL